MSLKLFELVGTDASRPFSPFCWRTRMALAHKGLSAETIPWCFTDRQAIAPHGSEKVPVLLDDDTAVVDSWTIANYLEDRYQDRPSLFGGEGGRAVGRMLNWWGDGLIGGMFPLIIADIPLNLKPDDAAYFRRTREARFKRPLEEIMADRDKAVEGFRKSLDPLRLTLKTQAFLGGAAPNYADYIVFGAPVGAGGQPLQAARRGRSGLCLARTVARRVRWPGAKVAELSRLTSAAPRCGRDGDIGRCNDRRLRDHALRCRGFN
jgi:glutathione S-transferase